MSNPYIQALEKGSWILLVEKVSACKLFTMNLGDIVRATYRLRNDDPPTSTSEGIYVTQNGIEISNKYEIDVYVYAVNNSVVRIETDLNKDVLTQDPVSESVNIYLTNKTGDVTLAEACVMDEKTFTAEASHGIVTGDILTFTYEGRTTQYEVKSVDVNEITVYTPFDYDYPTTTTVEKGSKNMKVDGSSSTVLFKAGPSGDFETSWHLWEIILYMQTTAVTDSSKFACITALTNGIFVRVTNGITRNIMNIKKNGDFLKHGLEPYNDPKAPAGQYSLTISGVVKDLYGIIAQLTPGSYIEIGIQDDLIDATITEISAKINAHIVI